MTVTSACAEFVSNLEFEHIPPDAIVWAKWGVLDCTGVALAGSATELARVVRDYLEFVGGNPQARIPGFDLRTSAPDAALAGGALAHALDYDDVGGFGHPTAVLLPVVYALADLTKPSGKEALSALIATLTEMRDDLDRGDAIDHVFSSARRWRDTLDRGR